MYLTQVTSVEANTQIWACLVILGIFGYIWVYLGIFGYIFGYIGNIWVYSRTSVYVPSKILAQQKDFLHGYICEIRDKCQL